MPFTDFSDIYAGAHEDGFNRIIYHVMRQRPSLFHYGTHAFVNNPKLLCCPPKDIHPEVVKRGNPLVSELRYLPIPGYTGVYGLEYNFSLEKLLIDFEPNTVVTLPPELGPKLAEQTLVLKAEVCGGIACPDQKFLDEVTIYPPPYEPHIGQGGNSKYGTHQVDVKLPDPPKSGLPFTKQSVQCFHLELYVVLQAERQSYFGDPVLGMKLNNLELVDIKPEGLENSLECFLKTTLRLGILPQLRVAFNALALQLGDFISIVPTPVSVSVPFNPAIGTDTLTVRLDLQTP